MVVNDDMFRISSSQNIVAALLQHLTRQARSLGHHEQLLLFYCSVHGLHCGVPCSIVLALYTETCHQVD